MLLFVRDEISKSLDGVIKDLASDPAIKTTARDLKELWELSNYLNNKKNVLCYMFA